MRFTSIYGKPLSELTYQEMMTFFKQHIFFKFMDKGRSGIENACREAVENFIGHFEQKGVIPQATVTLDEKDELTRDLVLRIVDGFIASGTTSFEATLTGTWVAIAQYKPK